MRAGGETGDVSGLGDGWYSYTRLREMEYHQKETFTLRISRQRPEIAWLSGAAVVGYVWTAVRLR